MSDEATQEHHPAHPSRTAFANEIADIVEQRLIAKFAKWVIINIGVLVTSVAVGIGAYYNHESRITSAATTDQLQERQMAAIAAEHSAIRAALSAELREIKSEVGEINRFLRDHTNGVTRNDRTRNP